MKSFLIAFVVFLVWSFFGLWIYSWIQPKSESAQLKTELVENNQIEESINNKLPVKIIDAETLKKNNDNTKLKKATESTLKREDNIGLKATNESGDIIFLFSEGISIKKNDIEINVPTSIIDYKYKVNTYLIEHPDQEIHINSIYSPKERIITPNIGLQRAEFIYKQLVETGVPKEKIIIKSVIKDIIFNEKNNFNSSIYLTFKPLDKNRIELLKNSVPSIRTVYPNFSESGILANKDLKKLLNELTIYFANNPAKKVEIVGHTDKIGNGTDNYNIGLKYAKQVRWYLISKGNFDKTLLKASSKGESEPIDDNNTHRGRIANRRIEVIFN